MKREHRNRYNEEFKRQVVQYYTDNHTTLAESATHYGITPGMLSKWVEQFFQKQNSPAPVTMNYEREIKQLQSELRDLKRIVGKAFLEKYSDEEIAEKMVEEPEKFLSTDPASSNQP